MAEDLDIIEFVEDYKIVKGKTTEELVKAVKAELKNYFEPCDTPVFQDLEGNLCKEMVLMGEEEVK